MNRLFLFDFDGTLTNKDTLFDFMKFSFPKEYPYTIVRFMPLFVLSKLKFEEAGKIKKQFISIFLKGKTKEEINELANNYFINRKDSILRPKVFEYLKDLKHDKYIVTASLDIWVKPFADYLGAKLISTKAEFKNNIFTGNFATPNCNYKEKVKRIKKQINIKDYDQIYAFGDSGGDKDMLDFSTDPHYNFF